MRYLLTFIGGWMDGEELDTHSGPPHSRRRADAYVLHTCGCKVGWAMRCPVRESLEAVVAGKLPGPLVKHRYVVERRLELNGAVRATFRHSPDLF